MGAISNVMQKNHRECDELFAAAEEAVSAQDWLNAEKSWSAFAAELDQHITVKEEGILFPAIEAVNGPMGPTQVMRGEHQQMRALVGQINEAMTAKDAQKFLGLSETLMMLMQQHNMKEEQILYPMIDQCVPNGVELLEQA
jgi:iron-sulfur cluster repair protein YtfE (RIC family)